MYSQNKKIRQYSMDRRFIDGLQRQETSQHSHPTHDIQLDHSRRLSTNQIYPRYERNMNVLRQLPNQQINQSLEKTQISARGHKRGYSDGVGVQFTLSRSKENLYHNHNDSILEGEFRLKSIEQKLQILEKKVGQTQQFLAVHPPSLKSQIDCNFGITQLITQIVHQKTLQLDENMQKLCQQIHSIKMHLLSQFTEVSNRSEVPRNLQSHESPNLMKQIEQKLNSLYINLRNQFQASFMGVHEKMKKLSPNKQYQQALNTEPEFFRTNRKYSGNPISFLYEEYIRVKENQSKIRKSSFSGNQNDECDQGKVRINQITYYIDGDGFLLDDEGHYLINHKNQQIKLSQRELRMLRKANILSN